MCDFLNDLASWKKYANIPNDALELTLCVQRRALLNIQQLPIHGRK